MAETLQLRRRIKAAQNVSKTTRAMQMIAATKLKRAQEATLTSREYVEKLTEVAGSVTIRVDKEYKHPYIQKQSENGKTLFVVISPDKGLCGGMITNLSRNIYRQDSKNSVFITVGKKIEHAVSYYKKDLLAAFPLGNTLPTFAIVYPVISLINKEYLERKVNTVKILSTHFQNMFTQKIHLSLLLPVSMNEVLAEQKHSISTNFLFEPNVEFLLPNLMQRYIEMKLYQEILESYLSEQAARMIAMQNATDNANDIIEDLKLTYNKLRQTKITNEILDISGAKNVAYE